MTRRRLPRHPKRTGGEQAPRAPSRLLARVPMAVWLVLALTAATLVATRPIGDNDYGFHLRLGVEIAEAGPPRTDAHSFTAPTARYPDHEWLSQFLWYQAHRVAGDRGMVGLQALLVGATLAVVALTVRRRSLLVALLAVDVTLLLGLHHIQMRPHLLAWLLTAVLGLLLARRKFLAIPPLLLLWGNCHGSVALAVAWTGLALLEEYRATHAHKYLWLGVAALLAPLANPYGVGVYTLYFEISGHTAFIGEWQPYGPDTGAFWLLALMFATAAAGLLAFRPFAPFDVVRVLVLAVLAFGSSRHGVVAALYLAPLFGKWLARAQPRPPRTRDRLAGIGLALVPVVVLALALRRGDALAFRVDHERLPVESVEFLHRHDLPAPLFNDYNFGGWLLWKGWPRYRVFIDGRTEVYKGAILDEYLAISNARGDVGAALDRWGIQTVLVRPERELAHALLADPGWGLCYFDYNSVVFVRTGSAPGVRRLAVVSPWGHRDPNRRAEALSEIEYLLAENPRFFGGWKIRAFLLAKNRDWARARDSLRRYLELHPEGASQKETRELVDRLAREGSWP